MIPDQYEETVLIPVRAIDGRLVPFYGTAWPQLRPGAIGEVRFAAQDLLDQHERMLLTARLEIPLLPAGTQLFVSVSCPGAAPGVEQLDQTSRPAGTDSTVVRVVLREELRLTLRGTKSGQLNGCRCEIPALSAEAGSLNQAYNKISEAFETHRISHTGNAFAKVLYPVKLTGDSKIAWHLLDELRSHAEALLEPRFGDPDLESKSPSPSKSPSNR